MKHAAPHEISTVPTPASFAPTASPSLEPSASAFDPPGDRFEEGDELGRGGMGRVVEAYDRALDRTVAIKYMLAATEVELARFAREARITARLEHPGIVAVHDAGRTEGGTPYYVMRRSDGAPLSEVVERSSSSARRALVPSLLAAADAIAYAHARGVIHRDLKPTNILIGTFGETLVIDWGLARTIAGAAAEDGVVLQSDPSLTRAGAVAGTPGFMSPEQARGEVLDARVDVYALGATLFYVLTGELPHRGSGATELIDLAGAARPPDWSRLPVDTPPDLRAIVSKAMAGSLEDRYPDAGALASDLRRFVTGQLVGAHRYRWSEQLWRFVRRHRAAVTVTIAALVVIMLGAVVSVRRVISERDDAAAARLQAEAAHRATQDQKDLLLVQHALRVAQDDPIEAILNLRQLPVESKHWRRAAAAAGAAFGRGIPIGLSLPPRDLFTIAVAPGSRRIAVLPLRGTTLLVVDLPGLAVRRVDLSSLSTSTRGVWLDDQKLVLWSLAKIWLFDVDAGIVRTMEAVDTTAIVARDPSSAWVLIDRELRRLDLAPWTLGPPLASDVSDLRAIGADALVTRGLVVEVWTPARTWRLTNRAANSQPAYGGGRVAIEHDGAFCTWILEPAPALERCLPSQPKEVLVAATRDTLYATILGNLVAIQPNGMRHVLLAAAVITSSTSHGHITIARDLVVQDGTTTLTLASGGREFARVAHTPDRRFVAALSVLGELLVWDVEAMSPELLATSGGSLVGISQDSLYLHEAGRLLRISRSTRKATVLRELVRDHVHGGAADDTGTWLLGRTLTKTEVLYHLPTNTRVAEGRLLGVYEGRAFEVLDGRASWIAPDGSRTLFATVEGATGLSIGRSHVLSLVGDREMCRQRRGEAAAECLPLPVGTVDVRVLVDDEGSGWMLSDGGLHRWPVGGTLQPIAEGSSFLDVYLEGGAARAWGAGALVDVSTDPPTATEIPPVRNLTSVSNGRLVGMAADGRLAVIDARNGASYALPLSGSIGRGFRVQGDTVAIPGRNGVWLYTLPVPSDPAALRTWLATITNATPIAGATASSWPNALSASSP